MLHTLKAPTASMRYLSVLICLLALSLALPALADGPEPRYGNRWIVKLVDAPTLEFTGTNLALQGAGSAGAGAFFEATAPAMRGETRFDVEAPHVQAYAQFLQDRQADFLADAGRALGRALAADGAFHHVANGLVLSITAAEAERLRTLPGVAQVFREELFHLELAKGPRLIGARALNDGGNQLPGVKGEGMVVGVIDSGINWDHRAFSANTADSGGYVFQNPRGQQLGLCSRADVPCNNKLIGVFDFTDDSTRGQDTDGHGTHVAAIAVANEWAPGQAGVAPRANLISYRVCVEQDPDDPDAGTCQGAAMVQAIEQAIIDRVDVVNFSIGSPPRTWSPWTDTIARLVLNLRDAGITFVTSGGNSGPDPSTVSWPAEAPWVFAVGASTTESCADGQIQIQNLGSRAVTYGSGPNASGPDLNNVLVRRGGDFDGNFLGCQSFPAGAFDNAVALLERGQCTFETKVNNAAAAGARAVLVFNNENNPPRLCMAGLDNTTIPSAMLSRTHGLELNGLVNSGAPQRVTFIRDNLADQVAGFSSRGPSANVARLMKPNVVAPGAGIQAAFIPGAQDVAGLSGTSMASPHVAGAIALLRQLNPGMSPAMITSVLETTAESAPVTIGGAPANVFDRGAGRIRVDLAARAGLYLGQSRAGFLAANPANGGDPGSLNLPGLINENCGNSCTFTRTVTALRAGSWTVSGEGQAGVSVSPSSFSLQAGESQTLQISVTPAGNVGTSLQRGAVVLTPPNVSAPVPGQVPLVPQRLPIGVRGSAGSGSVGGTADEPTGQASLNVDPAQSCPGFFVLRTHPGENSQPGRFGAEILLTGEARRTLQGGLNFGGRATADIGGFSAFSIANRTGEDQIVELTLEAGAPGRMRLERRSGGERVTIRDVAVPGGQTRVTETVPPGFYVVSFNPTRSDSTNFSVAALTRFTDRPGGGFQGGAVFGGYHDPTRSTTGFAGFCIAEPQDVEISVLSSPTYGSSAARGLEFSLSDRDGIVVIDSRD